MWNKRKSKRPVVAALLLGSMLTTPAYAGSATGCDACALEARVATLEAQMAQARRGGVDVPSDLTLKFGGYVKADFIYDVDNAGGPFHGAAGVFNNASEGGFQAHARQTRFNVTATKDTALGPIKAFLEIDFFGSDGNQAVSNSNNPRMRQAFVEWNGWLAGQSWSTFQPLANLVPTLDFAVPAGTPFIRQAQLRYTHKLGNGLSASVAIENPETIDFVPPASGGTVNVGNLSNTTEDYPDLVAALNYFGKGRHFRIAGVLRDLEGGVGNNSETGYGVTLGGSASLWQGGTLKGNFTWGKGIGRYLLDGTSLNGGDTNSLTGVVDDIEQWGFFAGLSQQLTDVVAFNAVYSRHEVEDTFRPVDIETLQTVHANLIWTPVERYSVGFEASWVEAERVNGGDADVFRLQSAVQFNF